MHIYNRQVGIAGLRATFAVLIETCRTDTDSVYSSESDPLSRCSVAFWCTVSSFSSLHTILLCGILSVPIHALSVHCLTDS